MYPSATLFKLFPYVVGALASIGPTANLVITNKNISPDGFTRSAVLAGPDHDWATFPGPLITANKGDSFNLNVVNELTDNTMLLSTSIHWHGMFQHDTSWSDGPVGVTQCPIVPGESYLYQFSSTTQAGTFWYHSHYSTQYCDGLRGALVVYDPQDPHLPLYDIDDESTVITLADWYHTPAPTAMVRGIPPTPAGTLINGLGRFPNGPTDAPLAPNFKFSIDGHNMTIIEVDTVNVEPLTVDSIQIFAGQRYSFVLHTNQPDANYWIRAQPNQGSTSTDGGLNSAILRYAGANATQEPPKTNPILTNPMLETNLHALENPGAPGTPGVGNADVNLQLNIGRNGDNRFTVNNVTFDPTNELYDLPVLLQIMSGAASVQDLVPEGSYYELPPNSVIELTIPGGTAGNFHPIHLHGHVFDVVRSAGSGVYNYDNPVRRDVVNIGSGGDMTTIRFKTDNAGPWILHCHIDWHLELGFAVVFVEDFGGIKQSVQPPSWDKLCPAFRALPEQTFPGTT